MKQSTKFKLKHGCVLMVVDPNLDEQIRRLSIKASDLGETIEEKDSILRCLINHCEAARTSLAAGVEPSPVFPL